MTPDPTLQTLIQETLDCMAIHDKCVELADCLLWGAATGSSGHPIYKPAGRGCTLVRRDVYRMGGKRLKPRVPIDVKCDERQCVNLHHLFESTTGAIARKAAKRGAYSSVLRGAKIAASRRGTMKLTMEKALAIRNSTESNEVLALRHGIHKSMAARIKSGKAWRDYSNPFAGLMA